MNFIQNLSDVLAIEVHWKHLSLCISVHAVYALLVVFHTLSRLQWIGSVELKELQNTFMRQALSHSREAVYGLWLSDFVNYSVIILTLLLQLYVQFHLQQWQKTITTTCWTTQW